MDIVKLLEDLRDEFDYESKEYGNPGQRLDPYLYGMYEGKSEAYEDAKFRIDEILNKIRGE